MGEFNRKSTEYASQFGELYEQAKQLLGDREAFTGDKLIESEVRLRQQYPELADKIDEAFGEALLYGLEEPKKP